MWSHVFSRCFQGELITWGGKSKAQPSSISELDLSALAPSRLTFDNQVGFCHFHPLCRHAWLAPLIAASSFLVIKILAYHQHHSLSQILPASWCQKLGKMIIKNTIMMWYLNERRVMLGRSIRGKRDTKRVWLNQSGAKWDLKAEKMWSGKGFRFFCVSFFKPRILSQDQYKHLDSNARSQHSSPLNTWTIYLCFKKNHVHIILLPLWTKRMQEIL